jgi:hypothetical protein
MSTLKTGSSRRLHGLLFLGGVVLGVPALSAMGCAPGSDYESEERTASPDQEALGSIQRSPHRALCPDTPAPGFARCHAHIRTEADGSDTTPSATPQGFTPSDLKSAYNITATATGTIAIIDAQDDPNAESDLAVYRSQFGLPACTTANGCFKKVNQNGAASPLPTADSGWAGEISLDLDMVSAACPACKIILVEANSASTADLGAAVNAAAAMGANAISNSYGGSESSGDTSTDTQYYNHPGIIITASTGDDGYGTEYPAAGAHVLAVGGTSLAKSTSPRGWAEGAWSDGGSGCSSVTAKPSWQKDTGCSKRTVADISAVADPNTGVAVYDTYGGSKAGATGWVVYGGTSASSPLVAAILVASGKGSIANSWPYANTGDFNDVTTGTNGTCSSSAKYLCTAGAGYDGPTGLGTPNGGLIAGGSSGSSSSSSSSTSTSSSSSSTSSGTSSTSSSSGGGGTCSHTECTTGAKLVSGCDPCVTKICAADSYCCNTLWDSVCEGEAGSICGETCGGGSSSSSSSSSSTSTSSSGGDTCSHNVCTAGVKLVKTCDACATEICTKDSYCCNTKWDSVCVGEATSVCGETCN